MGHINTKQLRHLLELDENGLGLGDEFQAFIRQITSGGVAWKMTNPRERLAKTLWDRGFGRDEAIKAKSFKAYLNGIPQIPTSLVAEDSGLSFLSLADPRPGLLRSCKLLGVQYEGLGYTDGDAEPFSDRFAVPAAPFWFRHDDGRANCNRRPDHCRDELTGDVQVGTAMEGVFAFVHHPGIVVEGEHIVDLPGTVRRSNRADCACLEVWDGQVELRLCGHSGFAFPIYGALRLRRK
ncbi:hypothetical protein HY631_01100 [Candidatus Uhrbacteria bacterium]|nr:hypothetical protein [Candidatus Uhrbacteria bacterium]